MAFKNFWIQYKIYDQAHEAQVSEETFTIGRAPSCELTINSDVVSRRHVKIYFEDNKVLVQDLGSTNGTFIDGEQLAPHEKYEYKSKDKLYIDVNELIILRITPLFHKEKVDVELDAQRVLLEKKKRDLKNKSEKARKQIQKEGYLNAATANVDNLFENLIFVAKSARFNKEKVIREAEHISQDLIDKAQREIEESRQALEDEIKVLQKETHKEAKRIVEEAKQKSKKMVAEAHELKNRSKKESEEAHQEVLQKAQEKHSEIIGEAYIKNKELKDENQKIIGEIAALKLNQKQLSDEMEKLNTDRDQFLTQHDQAKAQYDEEISNLNMLKVRISSLEEKGREAKAVLEKEVPGLELKLAEMKKEVEDLKESSAHESESLEGLKDEIAKHQDQLAKDEEKALKAEKRLDELSEKVSEAEDNLFRINKIKQHRNDEIDKEIAQRRARQKESEEETNKKNEKKKQKAEKEISINLEKAKEHAKELVANAKTEAEEISSEVLEAKKSMEKELEQQKSDTENYCADLTKKTDEEIRVRKKNLSAEVELEKDRLLSDAQKKSEEMIDKASKQAEELIAKAKKESSSLVEKAHNQADKDIESLEKEIENRKKETDAEIKSLRSNVVTQLEEQKRAFEKEEAQRTHVRVMRLRKELNDVLRARISPYLKDQDHLEKVGTIIGKSVNSIMLDEVDDNFSEMESYSDIDPSLQQKKVKKFWAYSAMTVVLLVIVFSLLPDVKQAAVDSGRSIAAKVEKETKKQIEKTQKENDLSKTFNPDKKEEFLETYAKRVLYTEDYVEMELNKEYREQWILELQDYFVHTLRLDENNLVPFIAQEANLIRELKESMKKVNGNFVDQGIKRMEEIEDSFVKKIRKNIKKKSDFNKIMKFKKEFFEKNKDKYKN